MFSSQNCFAGNNSGGIDSILLEMVKACFAVNSLFISVCEKKVFYRSDVIPAPKKGDLSS